MLDIQDRFLQVFELSQRVHQLKKVQDNSQKLFKIEQVLQILLDNGVLTLKAKEWPNLVSNLEFLETKLKHNLHQIPIVDPDLVVQNTQGIYESVSQLASKK